MEESCTRDSPSMGASAKELAVSFVVIGRDEAAHLGASVRSLADQGIPRSQMEVIYVDSGSVDGSPEIAQRFGADRIVLLARSEASAAKARNQGARLARAEFIQFVDGDTTLEAGWTAHGLGVLRPAPRLAGIAGALKESMPDRNLYHRVLDLDWPSSTGPVPFVGGNAMYRRSALLDVGGFDECLGLGEEPELGVRLRERGWTLRQLSRPMARHDVDISRFADYLGQMYGNGVACGRVVRATGGLHRGFWRDRFLGLMAWAATLFLVPLLALLAALQSPALGAIVGSAYFVGLVVLIGSKACAFVQRGLPLSAALAYALHTYFSKLPRALGALHGFAKG